MFENQKHNNNNEKMLPGKTAYQHQFILTLRVTILSYTKFVLIENLNQTNLHKATLQKWLEFETVSRS